MSLGVLVVLGLVPMSVHADTSPRVALSAGLDIGSHEHPDDTGTTVGFGLDAELRFGVFTAGGSIGYDDYAPVDGVPVHATTMAARVGLAVPLAASAPNHRGRIIE